MDEGWRYTLLVNNTDDHLTVDYNGATYTLVPKGYGVIRCNIVSNKNTTLSFLKFRIGDRELHPVFSIDDLCENKRIVILGDSGNSSDQCRMTPRRPPIESIRIFDWVLTFEEFWLWLDDFLRSMVEQEAKVRIWHNQCEHLQKKFQEAVKRLKRAFLEFGDFYEADLEPLFMNPQAPTLVCQRLIPNSVLFFLNRTFVSCMLEGEALLRSCGESSYNQAAFALTSVPPSVPTYSKFALAIRELAWIVDVVCCRIEGNPGSLDGWEWCEERCRLVFSASKNRLDATEDDCLEADVRRQNADREALHLSLDLMRKSPHLKLSKSPGTSASKFLNPATWFGRRAGALVEDQLFQDELESIWRKRLQASSCAPGSNSTLDAFIIENPDTSFVSGSTSGCGGFKIVQKCKWLGQTVAVATMSNVSKVSAQAEIGLLARAQHPNVVELMGYAYKEDRYPDREGKLWGQCFLVTEHMECDLHDLITERLRDDGRIIRNRSPFEFFVAVDIALQVVEAMIHVHRCRVLHRDLKPKNIIVSRKYPNSLYGLVPYTIKLIDFGSSKSNDENSHFDSRKRGTTMCMAPEVHVSKKIDEKTYSWPADVFSFGLTCFEIFTGRLPVEDDTAELHADIRFPFDYPGRLKSLILKCCALDPADRPSFEYIQKALWRLKVLHGTHEKFFSCVPRH